jgi:hypothetical protein
VADTVLRLEPELLGDDAVKGWCGRAVRAGAASGAAPAAISSAVSEQAEPLLTPGSQFDRGWVAMIEARILCEQMASRLRVVRELRCEFSRLAAELLNARTPDALLASVLPNVNLLPVSESPRPVSTAALPQKIFDGLNAVLTRALELAESGSMADGYTLLLAGLRRAERTKVEGEVWAIGLVRIYRLALENYTWRFGLRLAEPC